MEIGEAWKRSLLRAAALTALLLVSMGARFQSANYIVETADPRLAQQIDQAAERYRHDLAIAWLGQAMPNWAQPCLMTVQVGPHLGAGGDTKFVFDRGEVYGWRMTIQGSAERIFDSVLPHEVTHMVFATHFRRPLPRWADEGGATSMECPSERAKQCDTLLQVLRTGRGIPFNQMFAMTDYPHDILPLYAQGYTLAEYLIEHGGRRKYVQFLDDALASNQWSAAVRRHYGAADLAALQNNWLTWVRSGFPAPPTATPTATTTSAVAANAPRPTTATMATATMAAAATADIRRPRPEPNLIYHVPSKIEALPASGWHPVGVAIHGADVVPASAQESQRSAVHGSDPAADDGALAAEGLAIRGGKGIRDYSSLKFG